MAQAQPALQILSPAPNSCVNNGPEIFTGGGFFGQALPAQRDVVVELELSEPNAAPIDLTFDVGGDPILEAVFEPRAAGVPERTGDRFSISSFALPDGAQRTIRVTATSPAGQVVRQVGFRLDRTPPMPVVAAQGFPDLSQCYAQAPPVNYQVQDDQDPAPSRVERTEREGCNLHRVARLSDNCGNVQDVRLTAFSQPAQGDVQVNVRGFLCGLDACPTEGPAAVPFNNNARIGAGTVAVDIVAQPGCVGQVQARYFVNEQPPAQLNNESGSVLIPGQEFRDEGAYTVVVEVSACGARLLRRELAFTVLDRPLADPGGPYRVAQGQPLTLDGSGSVAAPEIGGIVEYAWDVDGDGLFDFVGPDQVRVPFDTSMGSGIYQCLLRITAGNGGVAFQVFDVEVTDVTPICNVGGPYAGVEGEVIAFDGSASAAADPGDPIAAFAWDFGDGLFPQRGAGLDRPNHIFEDSGDYTVTLRVEDSDSVSEPCSAQVRVADVRPVVEDVIAFGADALQEGDEVFFSSGATRPGSGSDPITQFCWLFSQGAQPECGNALRAPSHVYNDDGVQRVCLRVTDEEPDDFGEACIDIELADLQPTAALTLPPFATEGDTVIVNTTGSAAGGAADALTRLEFFVIDPENPNEPEIFEIDLRANPDQRQLELPLPDDGNLVVRLRVHDEDSFAEAEASIIVADVSPQATARAVYPDAEQVATEGVALLLDASNSLPGSPSDPIVAYRWDFGDGESEETDEPSVQHAWPDAGEYPARVVVVDEDGSEAAFDFTVTVVNAPPRVFVETDFNQLEVGVEAEFRLVVEDVDADRPPPSIQWEMGDGTTFENRSVVRHTFIDSGEFTINVAVDHPEEDNEAAEASLVVSVSAAAARFSLTEPRQGLDEIIGGREGTPLRIRLQVDSAALGDGRFDGPVILAVSQSPAGAQVEVTDDGNPAERKFVDMTWTPTYYQAGTHSVTVQALAPRTGVQRQIALRVEIEEAGSPLLAAVGGTASEGEVTLYRYGIDNGQVTFGRVATVGVGLGATSLAHDPRNGRRVFVATPGSGGVAVVSTTGQPQLLRIIPTGAGTRAVAWGDNRVWALNASNNTLAIIDPDTLKVDRVIDLAINQPFELAWLPEGFGELDGDRLAVVSARGDLALYDPAALQSGQDGLVARARLGGVLDRIVGDPATGWLTIADRKTRRVYRLSVEALLENPEDPEIEGFSTAFSPRDLAVRDGVVYVATDAGIWQLAPDGGLVEPADRTLAVSAVTELPTELLSGGGLIVGEAERVFNYTGELQRLVGAPGGQMRRLAAFVALED